jgi:hypothetical protein
MNSYWSMLQPNIDSFKLITQNVADGWDGGDTMQREGMYLCAMYYQWQLGNILAADWQTAVTRYFWVMSQLQCEDGWSFKRHPDSTKWYSADNVMSRDQLTSNICAMGYANCPWLERALLGHSERMMIFTTDTRENGATPGENMLNWWQSALYAVGLYSPTSTTYSWKLPDFTDPSIWGAYIRAFNFKILYPFLLLSDWILVINSLIICYQVWKDRTFCDHLSHQMLLLQSENSMWTPVSKLALWIYKHSPLCNPPQGQATANPFPPQAALDLYFEPSNNGPVMNEIYRAIWAKEN